jgi:hypothetical protein
LPLSLALSLHLTLSLRLHLRLDLLSLSIHHLLLLTLLMHSLLLRYRSFVALLRHSLITLVFCFDQLPRRRYLGHEIRRMTVVNVDHALDVFALDVSVVWHLHHLFPDPHESKQHATLTIFHCRISPDV